MKNIFLITDCFPFDVFTEAFLEEEVRFWARESQVRLTVLPMNESEYQRVIPDNVRLETGLAKVLSTQTYQSSEKKWYKIKGLFSAFFSKLFWRELLVLPKINLAVIKSTLIAINRHQLISRFLLKSDLSFDSALIYTYWHTEATYAAQSIASLRHFKVITRTHRFDLYEDIAWQSYIPLRRQFLGNIDRIYTICESAKSYLNNQYGFGLGLLKTSRLGVNAPIGQSKPSPKGQFHIVSCSAIRPVKNLETLVSVITKLAEIEPELAIKWAHIGGGDTLSQIKALATVAFATLPNADFYFMGTVENAEVVNYYMNTSVDVFVNTSLSEGVPVSIMEAFSFGIPVIAPAVGGINEMIIDSENGALINDPLDVEAYVEEMRNIEFWKSSGVRASAKDTFDRLYKADKNYPQFISDNLKLLN